MAHDSKSRPFLVYHSHRTFRVHAHSMLEAELQDIRRCLARLEHEMASHLLSEQDHFEQDDSKAA